MKADLSVGQNVKYQRDVNALPVSSGARREGRLDCSTLASRGQPLTSPTWSRLTLEVAGNTEPSGILKHGKEGKIQKGQNLY